MPEVLPKNPTPPEMNYETETFLNIKPDGDTATWASFDGFMKNMNQSLGEQLYQAAYYKDEGWGSTIVTGGQMTLTVTGDVMPGDAACDYLLSPEVMYKFGANRFSHLKLQKGTKYVIWPVTLANITPAYGDGNAVNALTVTIHGNGKPTLGVVEAETE